MTAKSARISFQGTSLILQGNGTLFWPEEKLLIVSDLHLEKGAALSTGAPLPQFDTKDTLERLQATLGDSEATKLICLGDSFHTTSRAFQMPKAYAQIIDHIAARYEMIWITGNHDSQLPARLPGIVTDQIMLQGILLCHEAEPSAQMPTISGHFHPKARIKLRARRLSARCFVHTTQHIIMPAFGSYTGGLNICDAAFSPFITNDTMIHLTHDNATYSLPFHKQVFTQNG